MRVRILLLTTTLACAAACGSAAFDVDLPGTPTPTQPTVSPTETPDSGVDSFGEGRDGALVVGPGDTVVVNTCHTLAASAGSALTLSSTSGFEVDAAILLLQVQDEEATGSNVANAGHFEVARIAAVSGTGATLLLPAFGAYSSDGGNRAQACTLPQFASASIEGTLAAAPWDGDTGGVLALLVAGTAQIAGTLSADAAGFRGGTCVTNAATASSTDPDAASGGAKGEGIAGAGGNGRGARTNGGGGGNPKNAGGGGGGGGGAGGRGGWPEGNTSVDAWGQGGGAVNAALRLFFGGGGGAGHANSGATATCHGAPGGGLVFVQVATASGGGTFSARGESATGTAPATQGAGGGGAGGTIWLVVGTAETFSPSFVLEGGSGANASKELGLLGDNGPGGGGGGGRLHVDGVTTFSVTDEGGANGTVANLPFGAAPGGGGVPF